MILVNIKNSVKSYTFWLLLWLLLVVTYAASMRYGFNEKYWDSVICVLQLSVDTCIGLFSYLAYKNKTNLIEKRFYFLIFLSIIPGLFANEVYNVLINIVGLKVINNGINVSWTVAYTAFLSIQVVAWFYLYYKQRDKDNSKTWITAFSYVQSAVIVFLSFLSIIAFRGTVLSEIGTMGTISSLLETMLFIAISICLARTRSKSLVYLEVGFLLLIAFNLAHRFSYSTGHYFRMFDIIWLISLVTITFGFIKGWKDKKLVEFFKPDSLHVYASAIFLAFSTISMIAFFIIDLILSSVAMNKIGYSNILPENIPSMLIFSYTLAFLVSKLVASYLSRPLEKISKRIDFLSENSVNANLLLNKKFKINELDRLDKFILKAIIDLQAANRVKSEFLMQMSHDFRTPATGISLLSRTIYRKIKDTELKSLQKLIVDSSEQLISFLDDVLDYSRLDSDQFDHNIKEFDVKQLIEEITLFVSAKVKDKNLFIESIFDDSSMIYMGDRMMLQRVVLNIVSNAIKFTKTGGVTLSLSKEAVNNNELLMIKIHDTGIGIDAEFYDFIFEPFNRIDSGNETKNSGIGLGLSNVKLMLKKMKGEVHLQSEVGKGSIFSISLPM